ncbi:MAG: glycosyltransferase family 4 protein [Chloroflexi bacterium]|nr:glycosyltransferase family 4 protein [Chloroflexota bacterium]MBM4467550.1 glycosyltransferase family 4 protein [Chloroflexota bacterium]
MKVCLISGEFPPMQGKVGDFTNELGKALAELGVEVSVITSTKARMQEICSCILYRYTVLMEENTQVI